MGARGVTLTKKIGIFFFQKSNFFSKFNNLIFRWQRRAFQLVSCLKRGDAHRKCKGDGREAL